MALRAFSGAIAFFVLTTAPLPLRAASDALELVIWNQYNGTARDRGTKACKVEAFSGAVLVWKQDPVELDWNPGVDTKVSVAIPPQSATIDRIRVSILRNVGLGGGLAEIELIQNGTNIAPACQVAASAFFQKDPRFAPKRVTDGITTSEQMYAGYWLLPDDKSGWIELKLPAR